MNLHDKLVSIDACSKAIAWVGDRSLRDAWAACHRGDWMLFLLGHMAGSSGWPTRYVVTLLSSWCARRAVCSAFSKPKNLLRVLDQVELCAKKGLLCDDALLDEMECLPLHKYSKMEEYAILSTAAVVRTAVVDPRRPPCISASFAAVYSARSAAARFASMRSSYLVCMCDSESLIQASHIRSVIPDITLPFANPGTNRSGTAIRQRNHY